MLERCGHFAHPPLGQPQYPFSVRSNVCWERSLSIYLREPCRFFKFSSYSQRVCNEYAVGRIQGESLGFVTSGGL
jgi:hypothetical protein